MKQHNQEIAVCSDCLQEIANGETPDGAYPTSVTRPGLEDCEVTLGGSHADDCPNHPNWQGAECDCENLAYLPTEH